MASPWPVLTADFHFLIGLAGLAIWTAWGWLAWRSWRSGRPGSRLPAAALAGSLLSLLPAAPLRFHVMPYLGYLAFAGLAMTLGKLVDDSRLRRPLSPSPRAILVVAILLAAAGWTGMDHRLSRRNADGIPLDPLVLRTSLSYESLRTIRALPVSANARIAILQVPDRKTSLDANLPYPTPLFMALGGQYGPALAGHPKMDLVWTHTVFSQHFSTMILADASAGSSGSPLLRHWGLAYRAYIYQALNHIGEGRYDEARDVLVFGMSNADEQMSFVFDPDQLLVPVERVIENAQTFLDLIPATNLPPERRDALSETARALLRTCGILPSITGG